MGKSTSEERSRERRGAGHLRTVLYLAIGGLLGVGLLHPLTMVVSWFEFHDHLAHSWSDLGSFLLERTGAAFEPGMFPMTFAFSSVGAFMGFTFALLERALRRRERSLDHLSRALTRDIPTLVAGGENEHVEFKSSARWDIRQGKLNRALGEIVVKTIAAFANHEGGNLLIGVSDDGEIVGLDFDYRTLRKKDRDGFQQFIMSLIRDRLGGQICPMVHLLFATVRGKEVCRIVVEPTDRPVYFNDGQRSRLYVRAGPSTRELDVREAIEYLGAHPPTQNRI